MMKIAVALAAYKGAQWIKQQINSILTQKGVYVTLFISVDKSDDGTEQIVLDMQRGDPRIRVLPLNRRYGSAAKNFYHLIKYIDSEEFDAVALSDQDDIWYEYKLTKACELLIDFHYSAYSSNVIAFWENGKRLLIDKAQPQRDLDYLFEAAGPGCTYVFSRETWHIIRNFVNNHISDLNDVTYHDWLLYALCRAKNLRWFIDPQPSLDYRQHSSNAVGANVTLRAYWRRVIRMTSREYKRQVIRIGWLVEPRLVNKLSNRTFLVLHCGELRRRMRDRLVLLIAILFWFY